MTAETLADLLTRIGNPRVTFWQCLIPEHRDRRNVVTVERDADGVARCTYPGCDLTSEHTQRYARNVAEVATERVAEARDRAEAALADVAAMVEPQWRPVPVGSIPDEPLAAFSCGRNWIIDRLREALPAGNVPVSRPNDETVDNDERSHP